MSEKPNFSAVYALSRFQSLHERMKMVTCAKANEDTIKTFIMDDTNMINREILENNDFLGQDFLADAIECFKDPNLFTQTSQWIIVDLLQNFLINYEQYKNQFKANLEQGNHHFNDDLSSAKLTQLIDTYRKMSGRPAPKKPELPHLSDFSKKKYPGQITEPPPGIKFKYLKVDIRGEITIGRMKRDNSTELDRMGEFSKKKKNLKPPSRLSQTTDTASDQTEDVKDYTDQLSEISFIMNNSIDYFVQNDLIGVFMENDCFPNFENCDAEKLEKALKEDVDYKNDESKINEIINHVNNYINAKQRKNKIESNTINLDNEQTITNTTSRPSSFN